MIKLKHKSSTIAIDEVNEKLVINGEEIELRKTDSGYGINYLQGFETIESVAKAYIDTQS